MTLPKTLLQLAGADRGPAPLGEATLVLIDYQNEYLSGPLELWNAAPAIAAAAGLLAAARAAGAPIIHVAHAGSPGGLFDRTAERGQIVAALAPLAGEQVVDKSLPNAFAGTELQALLTEHGRSELIIAGFMTHMCVSSTARAALDLGHRVTVHAPACATRDLPDGVGGSIAADTVHRVALAELADRFAVVTHGPGDLA